MNLQSPISEAVEEAVAERGEIGMQVAVVIDGAIVVDVAAGSADPRTGKPVASETLFPIFSVSKAIIATAVHVLVSRGAISYDQPIADLWPEFAQHGKGHATISDALAHRTGIPQMPAGTTLAQMCDWAVMSERIAALEPLWPVGARTAYHAYTFGWIVGETLRRGDPQGRHVDEFIRQEVCSPVGAGDIWFGLPEVHDRRVARLVDGPLSSNGTPLKSLAIPPGLATRSEVFEQDSVRRACLPAMGGIANAVSVARVFSALSSWPENHGAPLLEEASIQRATRVVTRDEDQILGGPVPKALGYFVGTPDPPPVTAPLGPSPSAFGHPGSGGSFGWADRSRRAGIAILKNRSLPTTTAEANPVVEVATRVRAALDAQANIHGEGR